MPPLEPLLRVLHVTDLHVVRDSYRPDRSRWEAFAHWLAGLHEGARHLLEEGFSGHVDDSLAYEFANFVEDEVAVGPYRRRTLLLDTGDRTTFGDSPSMHLAKDLLSAIAHSCEERVEVYGNHDAWPGRHPNLGGTTQGAVDQQRLRLKDFWYPGAFPGEPLMFSPPWGKEGPGIHIYRLNTVIHDRSRNALALGEVGQEALDRLEEKVQAALQQRPGPSLRMLLAHHPVHHPGGLPPRVLGMPVRGMELVDSRPVGEALGRSAGPGQGPLIHLVFSGHVHRLHPPQGEFASASHLPLSGGQMQITTGSLLRQGRVHNGKEEEPRLEAQVVDIGWDGVTAARVCLQRSLIHWIPSSRGRRYADPLAGKWDWDRDEGGRVRVEERWMELEEG